MLIQHRGQFKRLKWELAPLIAVIPKVPLLSSLVFYLKYVYKITYLLNFYYYPNKIWKGFRVFSSDYSMPRFSLVFYLKYIYKIIYLLNFYYYPNKIRKGFRVFSSDYSMARFSLPAKIRK